MSNPFFKNHGPIKITDIIKYLNLNENKLNEDQEIQDIKDLLSADKNDISFFHSKKYKDVAQKTKASFCLTTEALKNELPKNCTALVVPNVLVSTSVSYTHLTLPTILRV